MKVPLWFEMLSTKRYNKRQEKILKELEYLVSKTSKFKPKT